MATRAHIDKWGYERTGYDHRQVVAYAGSNHRPVEVGFNWSAWERRLAVLTLLAGIGWAVRLLHPEQHNFAALWETPGPIETCGISALLWVHAWWRSTVKLR